MKTTLKDFLVDVIPRELHNFLPRGFEVIGDIAILEIPEELIKYTTLKERIYISLYNNRL